MNYKLKANEVFCCNNGCGICDTHNIWDEYSTEISPCGNYKQAKSVLKYRSDCCNEGVFVWDTLYDVEVDCDMS